MSPHFGGTDREREFEKLYRASYSTIYGYVRARMSNDEDAEDIVAEAYLNAARKFDTFDPTRAKFTTWVTTIAKNCIASHYRRAKQTAPLEDAPQEACSISGEQDAVDNLMLVKNLLALLNDNERMIVACKYRDGMRNVDIAHELDMNVSTVSTVLARALSKMRAWAEKEA